MWTFIFYLKQVVQIIISEQSGGFPTCNNTVQLLHNSRFTKITFLKKMINIKVYILD